MPIAEYTVRLDAFEGPLDLLLFLIRRAEVEVTDIPIAKITEQYLKYMDQIADASDAAIDIERAGEFLVMAATLMEIKSRMLTPIPTNPIPAEGSPEGGEQGGRERKEHVDPRSELVKQLLEYKRFRDASTALDHYKREWEDMYPAKRALAGKPEVEEKAVETEASGPVDMDDIELIDLVEAFARIVETVDLSRVGEHRVVMDDTPVEIHAEDIVDRLRRLKDELLASNQGGSNASAEMPFEKVFEGRTRSDMIGLFLAILELVKQQRVYVRQEDDDRSGKRIVLKLNDSADAEQAMDRGVAVQPSEG